MQTPLNASGKNTSTTFFLPRKDESVTSSFAGSLSVKSGASWPTSSGIASSFSGLDGGG